MVYLPSKLVSELAGVLTPVSLKDAIRVVTYELNGVSGSLRRIDGVFTIRVLRDSSANNRTRFSVQSSGNVITYFQRLTGSEINQS